MCINLDVTAMYVPLSNVFFFLAFQFFPTCGCMHYKSILSIFYFYFYLCDYYLFQLNYKHEFYRKEYGKICQLFEIQTFLVFYQDLHFDASFYHKSNIDFLSTLFVLLLFYKVFLNLSNWLSAYTQ